MALLLADSSNNQDTSIVLRSNALSIFCHLPPPPKKRTPYFGVQKSQVIETALYLSKLAANNAKFKYLVKIKSEMKN